MKIGELAKRSGLSVYTIRYYEKIGLLPYAVRDASRQRDYDASILTWIEFLNRLKTTGMPIQQMLLYADFREKGDSTISARRILLQKHRDLVAHKIAEQQSCLLVLDKKIELYKDLEKRTVSNDAHSEHSKPFRKRKNNTG